MKDPGRIFREGDVVVVEVTGMNGVDTMPGVTCLNPDAPPAERRYRKVFHHKRVYLPGEYDRAISEHLRGRDVVVLGMNGYSELTPEQCRAWGVRVGAYEAACAALLDATILALEQAFPGIDVRLVHGASDLGVDRAIVAVGRRRNRGMLGTSCPRFMFWVPDDDEAVYVAENQEAYADSFVRSLDILIAANGRLQAFKHDLNAAFLYLKYVIPVNVLRSISTTGGPPAIGPEGRIEDAVAAFEQRVFMVTAQLTGRSRDAWIDALAHTQRTVVSITRQLISPERAFGGSRPSPAGWQAEYVGE